MPWFPDFAGALELARRDVRAAGRDDPVGQYVAALNDGDARVLETAWPGEVVVHDPHAGTVRGHRQLRRFVRQSRDRLTARHARVETLAATHVRGRAVVELLAHLAGDGPKVDWPVAVVAESADDRSVVFRTYCSRRPIDGDRHLRPAVLGGGADRPGGVVGIYQDALRAGDVAAAVGTFAPDGYYREPLGATVTHCGSSELRSFFTACFELGGGIILDPCAVTDDGVRCALEYNCVRWGDRDLAPQAGICVHEREPDGLLAAVRVYDDVEAPAVLSPRRPALGAARDGVVGRHRGVHAGLAEEPMIRSASNRLPTVATDTVRCSRTTSSGRYSSTIALSAPGRNQGVTLARSRARGAQSRRR